MTIKDYTDNEIQIEGTETFFLMAFNIDIKIWQLKKDPAALSEMKIYVEDFISQMANTQEYTPKNQSFKVFPKKILKQFFGLGEEQKSILELVKEHRIHHIIIESIVFKTLAIFRKRYLDTFKKLQANVIIKNQFPF